MKPYHVQSEFFSSWIDLEAVQLISDVRIYPEQMWDTCVAEFSIGLAFRDKYLQVTTYSRVKNNLAITSEEYKKAVDIAKLELAELQRLHTDLVTAWKAISK